MPLGRRHQPTALVNGVSRARLSAAADEVAFRGPTGRKTVCWVGMIGKGPNGFAGRARCCVCVAVVSLHAAGEDLALHGLSIGGGCKHQPAGKTATYNGCCLLILGHFSACLVHAVFWVWFDERSLEALFYSDNATPRCVGTST